MAIRSTNAYVINEEQDGFVAVDFDFINDDTHDLSSWELINQSSSYDEESDEEDFSFGEKSEDLSESEESAVDFTGSVASDVLSECLSERIDGEDVKLSVESSPSGMSPEYLVESIVSHHQFAGVDGDVMYGSGGGSYFEDREEEEEENEEDEEEDEGDCDLDDELVPYYVNNKFGRERMRKLGKRPCPKSLKTKRLTYNYNKAGCFRGKHGLGLKHSLI